MRKRECFRTECRSTGQAKWRKVVSEVITYIHNFFLMTTHPGGSQHFKSLKRQKVLDISHDLAYSGSETNVPHANTITMRFGSMKHYYKWKQQLVKCNSCSDIPLEDSWLTLLHKRDWWSWTILLLYLLHLFKSSKSGGIYMNLKSPICLYKIGTHFFSRFSLPQICAMFFLIEKKKKSGGEIVTIIKFLLIRPYLFSVESLIVNSEFCGKKLM